MENQVIGDENSLVYQGRTNGGSKSVIRKTAKG
jgi:hypothetical protein